MGRGWFLWLVQRCVGEVLAGEEDVKKDERWFPREVHPACGVGASWVRPEVRRGCFLGGALGWIILFLGWWIIIG